MKKLLLTLIVSFAFCGSIFAQQYESHWPDYENLWEDQAGICAAFCIDGTMITVDDPNWEAYELATCVFNEETGLEEIRGLHILNRENVDFFDDPYPITNGTAIHYTNPGETVYFKLWDPVNQIEYTICEATYQGEPIEILTGVEHFEAWDTEPYDPIILSFTEGIPMDIVKFEDHGWYLLSSPVGNVQASAVTNMVTGDYDLYMFDQTAEKEWLNYDGDTELGYEGGFELLKGQGYLYGSSEDIQIIFHGAAFTAENYVMPLIYSTENEDSYMHGWNLVGNPFNSNATIGDVPYYRMVNNVLTPTDAGTPINKFEGVFVLASAEGESVTFTPATSSKEVTNLTLSLSNGNKVLDRAIVSFGQGNNLPKFQLSKNSSKVYIPMGTEDYAIVRSEGAGEMPVNFKAESNGTYSLSFTTENVDFSYLHLIDNKTGVDQDLLANPSYSFSANTTDYASRFRLVFATGNEESFAFFSNGSLFINNEGNATLQVVDVTGRIIKCQNINGCANVNIDAAPGVYMVRLINGDNMKVQKVVK